MWFFKIKKGGNMVKKIVLGIFVCLISFNVLAQTQDIVKVGGKIEIGAGQVVKDAVVVGGDMDVSGVVEGDAVAVFGNIVVAEGGRINGSAVAVFGKVIKGAGAVLPNDTFEFSFDKFVRHVGVSSCVIPFVGAGAFWVFLFTMIVGFLALFLLISVFFTGRVGHTSYYIEKNAWKSFYYGLLIAVLSIPVTIFLVISIIGIPLVPILIIVLSAATLFGYTVVCQLIGLSFLRPLKRETSRCYWRYCSVLRSFSVSL